MINSTAYHFLVGQSPDRYLPYAMRRHTGVECQRNGGTGHFDGCRRGQVISQNRTSGLKLTPEDKSRMRRVV